LGSSIVQATKGRFGIKLLGFLLGVMAITGGVQDMHAISVLGASRDNHSMSFSFDFYFGTEGEMHSDAGAYLLSSFEKILVGVLV
jgi:hypothetical protein